MMIVTYESTKDGKGSIKVTTQTDFEKTFIENYNIPFVYFERQNDNSPFLRITLSDESED